MMTRLTVATALAGTLLATCLVSGSAQATPVPVLKGDATPGIVTLVGRGGGGGRHRLHLDCFNRAGGLAGQPVSLTVAVLADLEALCERSIYRQVQRPQKGSWSKALGFGGEMVGGTGIEPVTPTMSM